MSPDEINELRKKVRDLEKRAARKISRNRSKGVELNNSEFDPRRKDAPVNRYTSAQLKAYADRLNSFVSRRTQFVGGAKGAPIRREKWRHFEGLQKQYNAIGDDAFNQVRNVKLPNGMTVGQRMASTQSEFPRTANPAVNSPFNKMQFDSAGVTGERALAKLVKQVKDKMNPKAVAKEVSLGRGQLAEMLKIVGRNDIQEKVNKLTDKQFHLLWHYSNLAGSVSILYEIEMARLAGKDEKRWYDSVADDSFNEVSELVDWAGKVQYKSEKPD